MKKPSITEIATRYPNLVRAIQWTASASRSEASLTIWAYKNGEKVNAPRIAAFGTVKHLLAQATRYRNC